MKQRLEQLCGMPIAHADNACIYRALLQLIQQTAQNNTRPVNGRKLYYFSAEFLVGKLLINDLINLDLYDSVRQCLADAGKDICAIEELDPEPALGNGGLGRLAACFLDSIATLGLPGDGIGLLYHCGLFRQSFVDEQQFELPDIWLNKAGIIERTQTQYPVLLAGKQYFMRLYRLAVTGYKGRTNHLNLFDLDSVSEEIVSNGIDFPKQDISRALTLFLYPDDSDENGKLLRIYQQYAMVSAGAQLILAECTQRGCAGSDIAQYAAVQINDTHPSLIIPELIHLLTKRGIGFEAAVQAVTETCAYTNHTILAEALEKWPRRYLETVIPHLMPIIDRLDSIARTRTCDESLAIIDANGVVNMAHMAIHFTHSTNGVAQLHTQILKEHQLSGFHALYPQKFNNKTNGITFRRWLLKCNAPLTQELERCIGGSFQKDATALRKLLQYKNDTALLQRLAIIKAQNKQTLANWLKRSQGIATDAEALFSIQAKRLHEYKRQQLNLLFLIHQYLEICNGVLPAEKLVAIFGAKAAPAYTLAKDIIHAIRVFSRIVEGNQTARKWLQAVFIENYNVSAAEKLIPACDISEQISLAGMEASGTGNMKFMLNGALTLGTMDGANVEIAQLVGKENIYIFGRSADEVLQGSLRDAWQPRKLIDECPLIRRAVEFITCDEMLKYGNRESLERLRRELSETDRFQALPDFDAYIQRKQQAMADHAADPLLWQKRCLINIANAGYFSADRTVAEYNTHIWHLGE